MGRSLDDKECRETDNDEVGKDVVGKDDEEGGSESDVEKGDRCEDAQVVFIERKDLHDRESMLSERSSWDDAGVGWMEHVESAVGAGASVTGIV